jgi:hypothetical protein
VLIHPFAHGRRVAEGNHPDMDLTGLKRAKRNGLETEIIRLDTPPRTSRQHPLPC